MKFSTLPPPKMPKTPKVKTDVEPDTLPKVPKTPKQDSSLGSLGVLDGHTVENQDVSLGNLGVLDARKPEMLKTMGVDTFTLRAQEPPPARPAADILQTLHAEVVFVNTPAAAEIAVKGLLEATAKISRYSGSAGGMLGLDIETMPLPQWRNNPKAGLDPYLSSIRLIQIFDPSGRCYVFDMKAIPLDIIKPVIKSREMVAHNAIFEMKFLLHNGIKPLRLHCSLLMARVASGQPLMSLAKATELYLSDLKGVTVDKTLQTSNWSADALTQEQIAYAALDSVLARSLWTHLGPVIKASGQSAAYRRMAACIPVVAQQWVNGVPFDQETHGKWLADWQSQQLPLRERLVQELGINPDSGTQLGAWLEKHLDQATLATWPRTPTGKIQTNEDAFDRVEIPALAGLISYKRLGKKISAFGTGYREFIHPVTGRIHADFSIAGTRGGRFSCNRPNLQQAPSGEFRRLFKAPPGYQLVVADYSQVELRIAAIIAGDPVMLEAYRAGADLHRKTAAAVAGVPIDQVTKAQRQLAKACNFGLIYGMGGKTLAAYASAGYGVPMTLPEADKAKSAFFRLYSGIARWQSMTKARGTQDAKVKTAGGLTRDLSKEPGGFQLTKALNTPVQGTGAEILLAALALLPKHLAGLDARLVIHVHDEIVLEVADADVAKAKAALVEAMIGGFQALFPDVAMPELVEAHSGPDWYSAKG